MPRMPPPDVDRSPPPVDRPIAVPRSALGVLAGAAILAALYFGRDLFVPFALAVLISFVLDPLVTVLRRWRLPRAPAVALVMLCTIAVVGATSLFVASQAVQLSRDLPTYQTTIQNKLRTLRHAITGRGVLEDASRMLDVVGNELDATRRAIDAAGHAARQAPMRVQVEPTPPSSLQALGRLVAPVLGPLAAAAVVLVFVLFILLERNELRDRLLRLAGGDLHRTTDALNEAALRVSRYLTMQLLVNTCFALPMTIGLWLIGVPGALLWGVMAGALRFIPYAGLVIASIFPLTMAFAVDPGWQMLLWTAVLIGSLELAINYLVEPWLYGASTGLAPVAVLVSAAVWTALWGPIGLILATPLTVCLVVTGRHLPHLRFLDQLFGRDPVFDAPTRLYQRLLSGDVEEAIEMATQQAREQSLQAFYDDTAMPALRLAAADHSRGASAEHRHRVAAGMAALIGDLRDEYSPAGALADAVADAPGGGLVLCIGARWEVDTMAADMLAHALVHEGVPARHLPSSVVAAEQIGRLDLDGTQAVCLSYFSPSPDVHARYVCRRLRRLRPDLRIVLALWNAPPALLEPDAAAAIGADAITPSLVEAVLRVKALLAPAGEQALAAPMPANESVRLQALAASGALEPAMRAPFDRAAQRVADIFDTPMAMVSLVDGQHQIWQGAVGVAHATEHAAGAGSPARTTARETSICAHVVAADEALLVPDVARDPRFATNPVLRAVGARFYAGVPLRSAAGLAIGALCILDRCPRVLAPRELRLLQAMADDLMASLAAGESPARAGPAPSIVRDPPPPAELPLGTAPA